MTQNNTILLAESFTVRANFKGAPTDFRIKTVSLQRKSYIPDLYITFEAGGEDYHQLSDNIPFINAVLDEVSRTQGVGEMRLTRAESGMQSDAFIVLEPSKRTDTTYFDLVTRLGWVDLDLRERPASGGPSPSA